MRSVAYLAIAYSCLACSGGGSKTLLVIGDVFGKPDSTKIVIEVTKADQPVRGANVVIESVDSGRIDNLEAVGEGSALRYEVLLDGYVPELRLQITSGNDSLDASFEGPSPHTITRPPSDARVLRGDGEVLSVEWEADGDADGVTVSPEGAPTVEVSGRARSAELPLAGLEDGDQVLRVERSNEIELLGGLSGSLIKARYKVDNRFTLE